MTAEYYIDLEGWHFPRLVAFPLRRLFSYFGVEFVCLAIFTVLRLPVSLLMVLRAGHVVLRATPLLTLLFHVLCVLLDP